MCAASGIAGSRRPGVQGPATRWPLQGGGSRSRVGSFLQDCLQPMVPSTVSSASRCCLGLPVGWYGVGRSWFQDETCGRSPSWVCRCFCWGVGAGELTTVVTRSKAPTYPVRRPSSQRLVQDEAIGAAARLQTPGPASLGTPGRGQSPSTGWGGCSWLGLTQDFVDHMVQ